MTGQHQTAQPLHVLLTTDVIGGVWDFCWTLADELMQAGHRVTLLAFGVPSAAQRAQALAAGAMLQEAPLKLEWMQESTEDVCTARALTARLAEELEADVLHANQYALGDLDIGIPVVLTAHSDVLSWERWTRCQGSPPHPTPDTASAASPTPDEYVELVRRGLFGADGVVAVSHFLAGELRELYQVDREIGVIHNGWPSKTDTPVPLAERERVTLLAGRAWDEAKNVRLAAEAARGWACGRVVLAGDQHHPESGSFMEIGPPIEPLGRLSREAVDRWLALARVYLAPARYEPFGLLPLQAALAGCPLLLSDIPSFRELWNGAALFFRAEDADDLRRQWARLLEDEDLAVLLAARAQRRAQDSYASGRMAAEYVALYRRVGAHVRRTPSGRVEAWAQA